MGRDCQGGVLRDPRQAGSGMKRYTMTFAAAMTHTPDHPERTARKNGKGMNFDVTFQVWPSRAAMLKTIELQEKRESRQDDWKPVAKRVAA